ncbi:MAG: hypothetical protein GC162_10645 [Planctomycetes bacterium]|nr:hypothetical protein [Planctomycetota bacterium]
MAKWEVPDELDARVREHVGSDVAAYVTQVISGQLDFEDDPGVRAELIERTRQGIADAGRVRDARAAMQDLANKHGLTPPQ